MVVVTVLVEVKVLVVVRVVTVVIVDDVDGATLHEATKTLKTEDDAEQFSLHDPPFRLPQAELL